MIIRNPDRERYTIVSNVALEDDRLSWEARGLLAYLLSKPDTWEVYTKQLVQAGPAGRVKIRRILRELEAAGYIRRNQDHRDDGTFDSPDVLVFEFPQVSTGGTKPASGSDQEFYAKVQVSTGGRFTARGLPAGGEPAPSNYSSPVSTEGSNYSSSSSALIEKALAILDDRHVETKRTRRGHDSIVTETAWRATDIERLRQRHWTNAVSKLEGNPHLTAEELAEKLEPPPALGYDEEPWDAGVDYR